VATKPEAAVADAAKPAKSKKMLIIIIGVVLLLVLGGGGAFLYISKQRAAAAAAEEDGGAEPATHAPAAHDAAKTPPVYLPMDNMVVNLADPGGERVAQVGITLEVRDAHAADTVKAYMPTIRSSVLILLSQRLADELLTAEGKQKLIDDILLECSRPFGGSEPEPEPVPGKKARKKAPVEFPVVAVLFSSLIVQ
jgi:flagellar FliL protein